MVDYLLEYLGLVKWSFETLKITYEGENKNCEVENFLHYELRSLTGLIQDEIIDWFSFSPNRNSPFITAQLNFLVNSLEK